MCMPKAAHLFLEQDKRKVRELLQCDDMIRVASQEEFDSFLREKKKIFARVHSQYSDGFHVFEEGKPAEPAIDFSNSEVLLEPYKEGRNITITYYIDNGAISILPIVFDYPGYISNGDFVKTSGVMCEYSASTNQALGLSDLSKTVLQDISGVIPEDFCGFLATQILYDEEQGIYHFIEFDIKPGEPEFINVINALDSSFNRVLNNCSSLYVPAAKNNESLSVAVAARTFPRRADTCISNYRDVFDGEAMHYSRVNAIGREALHNVNGGRIGFVFQEAQDSDSLWHQLLEYKRTHSGDMRKAGIDMFLMDVDSKELVADSEIERTKKLL